MGKSVTKQDTELRPKVSAVSLRKAEHKRAFIEGLSMHGTISAACRVAGMSRQWYYKLTAPTMSGVENKFYDAEFVALCTEAIEGSFTDVVMEAVIERAVVGWVDNHYDRNGNLVREEHKYDSALLQMLAKKADPTLRDKPLVTDNRTQVVVHTAEQAGRSAKLLDDMSPAEKKALLELNRLARDRMDDEAVVSEQ